MEVNSQTPVTCKHQKIHNVYHSEHFIVYLFIILNVMSKMNELLPKEKRILSRLGENLKLARLRRKFSAEMVSERARISRTTLWNIETGKSTTSITTLLQVLSVYGLEKDLLKVGEDDILGRKILDSKLSVGKRVSNKKSK